SKVAPELTVATTPEPTVAAVAFNRKLPVPLTVTLLESPTFVAPLSSRVPVPVLLSAPAGLEFCGADKITLPGKDVLDAWLIRIDPPATTLRLPVTPVPDS